MRAADDAHKSTGEAVASQILGLEMNAVIQRITDIALEVRIKAFSAATRLFLWLGDKSAALQCWTSMCALIARRSDAQVARMEKARGLR